MNAYDENLRPEDIERDIEHTRAEVSSTIDAIQSKLTPGQLMDQAIDYFRRSGPADFGSNLGRTVRDNPMPVMLVGIGLAWLMASGPDTRPRTVGREDDDAAGSGLKQRASDMADRAREKLSGAQEQGRELKEKAAGMADRARETIQTGRERLSATADRARAGIDSARTKASELGERSRERYHRTRDWGVQVVDEQPLVLAAVGVAIGAALGAGLPPTRREDEVLGESRDRLVDRAKEKVGEQADAVKATAQRAAEAATSEAESSR